MCCIHAFCIFLLLFLIINEMTAKETMIQILSAHNRSQD
jgi:hypothetical protein